MTEYGVGDELSRTFFLGIAMGAHEAKVAFGDPDDEPELTLVVDNTKGASDGVVADVAAPGDPAKDAPGRVADPARRGAQRRPRGGGPTVGNSGG